VTGRRGRRREGRLTRYTMRRAGFALALTLGVLLVPAVAADRLPRSAVDDRGRTIALDAAPKRIVAIGAFYAQAVADLGAADLLVGLADSPDNPLELDGVPSVGPSYAPSVERIVALSPDLVLGATDWNGDREALELAGIVVYSAPWFTTLESILSGIESIASVLDREPMAATLTGSIARRILELEAEALWRPPVRAAYVYGGASDELYAVGQGTPEDELLARAGGTNLFADLTGYVRISVEALLAADPDVIVGDPTQLRGFEQDPTLATLRAVRGGRLIGIPSRLVGSTRVAEAFAALVAGLGDG